MSKKLVSRTTHDNYQLTHTQSTTSVYKDSNNQRYSVTERTVSRASHENSSNSMPRSLTNGSGGTIAGPRDRTTFTQTSTTTYRGPGNEKMVVSNRNFNSNIQKSSYNPGQKAIGGGNYSKRGSGDVARYNGGGYYH